jgi:two-component system, NarL family, response regulator DevR
MPDTRVMIVDDHEVVREGLRALVERREGLSYAGEAATVREAIEQARRLAPDVVIMDVRLADGSGVEACREIRAEREETCVLMLTSYADDEAVLASILAGASGYLLKEIGSRALADAIRQVAAGQSLLDPAVTAKVMERLRKGPDDNEMSALNDHEHKILSLIAEGKTNKEIAAEVYLSDKTVKNYVSSILAKLNVRRRSEAAAFIARRQQKQP